MRPTIAIIGGGITGLAAAHRLVQLDREINVVLLEAAPRLGGVLQTTHRDGFLVESAADGFLTTPSAAMDLCRSLGLADELIAPSAANRQALVVRDGHLQPVPAGFTVLAPSRLGPLLRTPILSLRGKLRAALEYVVPRQSSGEDESLESFVCRRFGRELLDRLVQPLVGGIYSADPRRLSVAATMPRFLKMEQEHGSLIRAMLRQRRQQSQQVGNGVRYAQFAALRGGMSALIGRLAESLPVGCAQPDSLVAEIMPRDGGRWSLCVGGARPRRLTVEGVLMASPAHPAARLLAPIDRTLSSELREIEYAGCALVSLGYRRQQIGHPLDGFGFVVPLVEQRTILSCSFSSVKYEGRAPKGTVLLRVFIGGACQSGLLRLSSQQLIALAEREVADLLRIQGQPLFRHCTRQPGAMPQYHVGHRDRVARIEARLQQFPTLALAGSALHGVGVPGCIQSGTAAAERLVQALSRVTSKACEPVAT